MFEVSNENIKILNIKFVPVNLLVIDFLEYMTKALMNSTLYFLFYEILIIFNKSNFE